MLALLGRHGHEYLGGHTRPGPLVHLDDRGSLRALFARLARAGGLGLRGRLRSLVRGDDSGVFRGAPLPRCLPRNLRRALCLRPFHRRLGDFTRLLPFPLGRNLPFVMGRVNEGCGGAGSVHLGAQILLSH